MRVLALDPGNKVGWARADIDPATGELLATPVYGISLLKDMAMRLIKAYQTYDVVVMETFVLQAGKAKQLAGTTLPTVQFIGMVRLLSWMYPKVELVMQSPTVQDTARATIGKYHADLADVAMEHIAHDEGHHQSALLHLWHYVWANHINHLPPKGD